MLEVTELRKGTFFQQDGVPFQVIKYEHIKMGRGTATIKVKVINVLNGATVMKSFISGSRVEEAGLDEQRATYQYRTATDYVFAPIAGDEDDEQIEIPHEIIAEQGQFLKKGMEVTIVKYEDRILSIRLPIKAAYIVKEAPPDARGNTVSGGSYKEVVLDNNTKVKVPMFIKEGESIVVDTRTGEYISRA